MLLAIGTAVSAKMRNAMVIRQYQENIWPICSMQELAKTQDNQYCTDPVFHLTISNFITFDDRYGIASDNSIVGQPSIIQFTLVIAERIAQDNKFD